MTAALVVSIVVIRKTLKDLAQISKEPPTRGLEYTENSEISQEKLEELKMKFKSR